jgi:fucose permease
MSEPKANDDLDALEPVHEFDDEESGSRWTRWLVLFLRVMAGLSMLKGLFHWSRVIGVGTGDDLFETHSIAWQTATVFFAVIDLVAAVGLWLAAAWGGVVWLTAAISMAAVELFFPQIFGGALWVIPLEVVLIGAYVTVTILAGRERPE